MRKEDHALESSQEGPLWFPQESRELAQSLLTMDWFLAEPALGRGGCWIHIHIHSPRITIVAPDHRLFPLLYISNSQGKLWVTVTSEPILLCLTECLWFVVIDRAVVYKKRVTWGLFAFQKIGEGIIKFWLGPKIKRGGEWKRDIISFKINFSGISNLILFFSRCVFINWTSFHCH